MRAGLRNNEFCLRDLNGNIIYTVIYTVICIWYNEERESFLALPIDPVLLPDLQNWCNGVRNGGSNSGRSDLAAKSHLSWQSGNRIWISSYIFYLTCQEQVYLNIICLWLCISLLLLLLKKSLQSYTVIPAWMNWCVAACPKLKLDGTKKNWYVIDCPCTSLRMLD